MHDAERKARPTQMLQRFALVLSVLGLLSTLCGGLGGMLLGVALNDDTGQYWGLVLLGAPPVLVCTPLGLGMGIPGFLLLLLSFYATADIWLRGRMDAEEEGEEWG